MPPDAAPRTASAGIRLRDASRGDVIRALRSVVGLAPDEPAPGELAAQIRRSLPSHLHGLDADAWLAWCVAGLLLFGDPFPTLRQVRTEASRVAMALAMLRKHGNLSAAARLLDSSRKVLRDNLRVVDLYPWHHGPQTEGGTDDA